MSYDLDINNSIKYPLILESLSLARISRVILSIYFQYQLVMPIGTSFINSGIRDFSRFIGMFVCYNIIFVNIKNLLSYLTKSKNITLSSASNQEICRYPGNHTILQMKINQPKCRILSFQGKQMFVLTKSQYSYIFKSAGTDRNSHF